mgnify:CR=1 FL=1|jgi:hypothetical protein
MYHQIDNIKVGSFTHSTKIFMSGMVVAFIISFFINYNQVTYSLSANPSFDCSNQTALVMAQDRSRNGIANGCSNQFKIWDE